MSRNLHERPRNPLLSLAVLSRVDVHVDEAINKSNAKPTKTNLPLPKWINSFHPAPQPQNAQLPFVSSSVPLSLMCLLPEKSPAPESPARRPLWKMRRRGGKSVIGLVTDGPTCCGFKPREGRLKSRGISLGGLTGVRSHFASPNGGNYEL
jgi:hypothetical protein